MPDRSNERAAEAVQPEQPMPASGASHAARTASAAELIDLEAAERQNQGRHTVLEAIEARRNALQNGDQNTYSVDDMVASEPDAGRRAMIRAAFAAARVERLPMEEARGLIDHFAGRPVAMPGERA